MGRRSLSADVTRGARPVAAAIAVLIVALLPSTVVASDAPSARFAPGELLVRFNPGADRGDRTAALREVNAETRERLFVPGLRLVEADAAAPSAARELERQPGVRYAEPNYIDQFDATPNDPSFPSQWALNNTGQSILGTPGTPDADIDAPEAWDQSIGKESVIVGIADTGVDYTHPDLAPNIYTNPGEIPGNSVDDDGNGFVDDFRGWDFVNDPTEDNNPAPSGVAGSEHGTLVAGAAGAQGNNSLGISGVSQQVGLLPLRVGDTTSVISNQIQAYGYAKQQGADVVNLSAGGTTLSQARLDAIKAAPNVLFVFAAGNSGTNNDTSPIYPCVHNQPNIVCVAATTQSDVRSGFSNFGANTVDLAAPGSLIETTTPGGGYAFRSGTSFAAPIVAGAAALYRAVNPSATAAQTRNALRARVDRLESLDGVVETDGRLNLNRTLDSTAPDSTITKAPKNKLKTKKKKKKVTYEFTSSEANSTLACNVDDKGFAPCSSPFKKKFKRGKHSFQVLATDGAGNADVTPDTDTFKVKRKKKKK
jgi:subtilisin family serine protease